MEDLIAETPAEDIEGVGIKLTLYVYMSGVDPETADSAVEQVLSASTTPSAPHYTGWRASCTLNSGSPDSCRAPSSLSGPIVFLAGLP
jgi:hypothetical protein